MDKEQFLALIQKYLAGEATLEDEQLLLNFYGSFQDSDIWNEAAMGIREEIEAKMLSKIQAHVMQTNTVKKPILKLWPRIAVAAAAAVIIFGAGLFYFGGDKEILKRVQDDVVQNDIAPGKNGATITLANGKVIALSDAKTGVVVGRGDLKYTDGVAVQGGGPDLRQDDVMELTASTAKGQTYQFTLPDGTKVWLNADSKISFPSQFSGNERKILLSGEAYFEVAKLIRKPTKPIDKGTLPREKNGMERVPFMVETDQQIVEVLGTHFNVNSYADEGDTKTTLLEGSVRVLYPAKGPAIPSFYRDDVVLEPNQQSILTGSDRIKVEQVDVNTVIGWKNGLFTYKNTPVSVVMRQIERWYNVSVNYNGGGDASLKERLLTGSVSRYDNVSGLLKAIELTGAVKFKMKDKTITVYQQ
jgi:transmembrane sensor